MSAWASTCPVTFKLNLTLFTLLMLVLVVIVHDSSRHIIQNISSEFNNLLCLDFYFHMIHLD